MNLSDLYKKRRKLNSLDSNVNSAKKFPQEVAMLFVTLLISCALIHYIAAPLLKETRIIKAVNEIKNM